MGSLRYRLRCYGFFLGQRLSGRFVFIHINKCGGTSVETALGIPMKIHDTARLRRIKLGRHRWEAAFTFALVRHPADRMISFYKYRTRTNQTGMRERPIELNAWLRAVLRDRDPVLYDIPRMFAPCFDWVSDGSGRIIVDHIARLEEIEAEWPVIQERTGLMVPLPVRNFSHPGLGRDALAADTRRLIESHFHKDFEAFGYAP